MSSGPYWLTLDPTPSTERSVKPLLSWLGWLFQRWSESDNVWRNLIMDYNADQQTAVLDLLEREFMPEDLRSAGCADRSARCAAGRWLRCAAALATPQATDSGGCASWGRGRLRCRRPRILSTFFETLSAPVAYATCAGPDAARVRASGRLPVGRRRRRLCGHPVTTGRSA